MIKGKPIAISFFPGMNNTARIRGVSEAEESIVPQIILNMDVTADAKLIARGGQTLFVSLKDAHSLTTDGADLFCMAKGTASPESFWKISPKAVKTEIGAIHGKNYPASYVIANNKIYMSSKVWNGIYEYSTGAIGAWGQEYSNDPAIIDNLESSEEMLTLNVRPPRYMENLCLFGTRIWGSVDNEIDYSEPYAFEWFRDENRFKFLQYITMIAPVLDGLYVASEDITWFMAGTLPEEMTMLKVGDGAMPGSLQYGDFIKFGNNIPIWTSKKGIVIGLAQGIIKNLTSGRIRFDINGRVASLFRHKDGVPQYLGNFALPSVATFGDSATAEVVRNGKLI